jgi:ATP-dependent RNA helicase DDX23/PRP28
VRKAIIEKKTRNRKKKSRTFRFDWDASEDTSKDTNPLYDQTMRPALSFGKGYVAGVDLREQRKHNRYIKDLLDDRQSRQLKEEKELKLTSKEIRRRELSRKKERASMMRRAKKIDDEMDKKLAIFDSTKHWRDKMLSDMTKRDWRILREDFDIRIRRGKAPNPLRYWDESEISESILKSLSEMGFKTPSPIQRQAIPIGMEFRDVIGIAETGSGKTAAFVIPMIHYIQQVPSYMRERTWCCSSLLILY